MRGSRVRKPARFSGWRRDGSWLSNARDTACLTAPACPEMPPPVTFAEKSNWHRVPVATNGLGTQGATTR
eukprot:scaffold4488_cov358-Prasinococcus_capsulatus_cf.AAC.11